MTIDEAIEGCCEPNLRHVNLSTDELVKVFACRFKSLAIMPVI